MTKHPVDLDHLEEEIHHTPLPAPARDWEEAVRHTPLQIIAHAITRLTWNDAERMGNEIKIGMNSDTSITSAIQAWAANWKKFDDNGGQEV